MAHGNRSASVPAIRKNIIVPADASVDLKIDVIDAVQLKGYTVWPAQPSYKTIRIASAFSVGRTNL